jgi:predicted GIY-YIG superfamily endonuclease
MMLDMRSSYRDTTCPQPGQVALYRFYDAREELLYVGISNDPWRRRKEHSVTQHWYPRVRHQSITWYDSEHQARSAETSAIRQERPHFNKAGAIRPARARFHLRVDIALGTVAFLGILPMALVCIMVFTRATPLMKEIVVPVAVVTAYASMILWPIVLIVAGAPLITRFGAWLERNTVSRPDVEVTR